MQKILFFVLIAIIALFQYELWMGRGGVYDNQHLASTISQQVAKNVFLYPSRSWVRKVQKIDFE